MRRIIGSVVALFTGAGITAPTVAATNPVPQVATSSIVARAHPRLVHRAPLLEHVATRAGVSIAQLRAEWQHVAICEVNGNWSMTGPVYSGIGFLNSTWLAYGGTRFAQNAGRAPRDAQILIGMRVTKGWVPDQLGCSPTGW
ncbi:MAG TPA: transglycosylase family protein [Acidimicrobiales bacterium]|nr:transglycosylase family protein [Acidimicrobiales bacterium]